MKKTKLALTAIVALTTATVATGAAAHEGKKAHKHAKKAAVHTVETHSSSFSHSSSSNAKVDALEAQLQAMQSEIRSLRAAQGRAAIDPDTAKVQELDQWMTSVKSEGTHSKGAKDNMVFFRGGFASMNEGRNGVSIASDVAPIATQDRADKDAWYFGAGFDWSLNDNLFGMMNNTEVLAELMFEYKEFADNVQGNALATNPTPLAAPGGTPRSVTVNQLSVTAAPKIKFMKGSNFRPWLIPAGFAMHVISPPSESITVLNPGIMFGAGADYRIWKDLYAGIDGRYHLTGSAADGVNTDGFTAGGYLGIGF